ncbi:MAG: hypothetical protein NVS3B21_06030 [Acidimicrobiales bacterium]
MEGDVVAGGVPGAWAVPPAAGAAAGAELRAGAVVDGEDDGLLVVGGELVLVVGIGIDGWPGAASAVSVVEVATMRSAPTAMATDSSRPDTEASDISSPLLPASPPFLPSHPAFFVGHVTEL